MEIVTEQARINVDNGTMGGYMARPADGVPRPGILVFMEIFGINSHIRSVTDRVAAEGYVALAPDFFHRTGPEVEYDYDEKGMEAGIKLLNQLDANEMTADAIAAISFLKRKNYVVANKFGAMGFCVGGHMAYLTACETDVAATASFYGGGISSDVGFGGRPSTLGRTNGIDGRVLCLFGGKDALIPQKDVEKIRNSLAAYDVRHEVVVYPQADHGFFCNERSSYDEAAASDAWTRVKELFANELAI